MRRVLSPAFTLIELLVVIAIIGILASILMPVFTHARGKGRQAACISNLNQIGIALHMYADDHDEMFPMDWPSGRGSFWYERIDPYVKNKQVGICPQVNTVPRQIPGMDHPYTWTYVMNSCMCRPDMWGDNVLFDLARLQTNCDVSRMMMASEAIVDGASPEFIVASWWPYTQYHILPHNDMADVLFVDGHVKALGAGAVFSNYPGILQQ